MFKELQKTMDQELKEIIKTMCEWKENINRHRKYKKNQIEILELKDVINEMKKMQWRASTLDLIKQKKESGKAKMAHLKEREKRMKKSEENLCEL